MDGPQAALPGCYQGCYNRRMVVQGSRLLVLNNNPDPNRNRVWGSLMK